MGIDEQRFADDVIDDADNGTLNNVDGEQENFDDTDVRGRFFLSDSGAFLFRVGVAVKQIIIVRICANANYSGKQFPLLSCLISPYNFIECKLFKIETLVQILECSND